MTSEGTPTPDPARLQRALGDQWRVVRRIGVGGFAEVWEAVDTRLDRHVAVKVLRPDLVVSETLLERFEREARAIARLRHPNVVEIYTVDERDGVAFYVMPLVRGESLADRLDREGALDPVEAERIVLEAAAGLGAAHRAGLVHRDVKPANILLDGEERRVLLTDFGIAKAFEAEGGSLTAPHTLMGTPGYVSPEQASGEPVDHRSDLYSLGVVAYEMLSGTPPFTADTPRGVLMQHLAADPAPLAERVPECPATLARVVARCLAKRPEDRWPDAQALAEALTGGLEEDGAPSGEEDAAPSAGGESTPSFGGESAEGGAPLSPLRAFRFDVMVAAAAVGVTLTAELLLLGQVGFGLAVVLAAGAYLVARWGRLRRAGWAGGVDPGAALDRHPGWYAEEVRASRTCRASIIRLFHRLSKAERGRFPELLETVDEATAAVQREARRLDALEERLGGAHGWGERRTPPGVTSRGTTPRGTTPRGTTPRGTTSRATTPTGAALESALAGEVEEARERALARLHACLESLEQIRHWLVRSGGSDSEAVHDQLVAAVARTRTAIRPAAE